MTILRSLLTASMLTVSVNAMALEPGAGIITPTVVYDCQVVLVAKDVPAGGQVFKYEVTTENLGNHGGREFPFAAGEHRISALSNGRWLGISWWRGEELLGQTIYARNEANQGSEALVVYNVKDQEEQVSLDCTRR
jgi:hypothetical protein